MTRSWERRSLAAATIFMALVICCVFLTLVILRLMSLKLGIGYPWPDQGIRNACAAVLPQSAILRLRAERLLELLDQCLDAGLKLVVKLLLGGDVLEQVGVLARSEL